MDVYHRVIPVEISGEGLCRDRCQYCVNVVNVSQPQSFVSGGSEFVSADILVRPTWYCLFSSWNSNIYRIKISKEHSIQFWKQNYCLVVFHLGFWYCPLCNLCFRCFTTTVWILFWRSVDTVDVHILSQSHSRHLEFNSKTSWSVSLFSIVFFFFLITLIQERKKRPENK